MIEKKDVQFLSGLTQVVLQCKISKNPFTMFIWVQKSIEFYLKHYQIPQSSVHTYVLQKTSKMDAR